MDLNDEEIQFMLMFGDGEKVDYPPIPKEQWDRVTASLLEKNLLDIRASDGNYDVTDIGDEVFDELIGK
jgi:hypothetical protein